MLSLRSRLLAAAGAVLLVFLGLCGVALETAFRDSAREAQRQRLQGLIYTLLGAATSNAEGRLAIDEADLAEPRLRQPQSGLEAALIGAEGRLVWHSTGTGAAPVRIPAPEVGEWWFERLPDPDRFALAFGLRWIDEHEHAADYTLVVFESPEAYELQLGAFRRTLWASLAAVAVALLAALVLVLHWGLAPLRRLTGELRDVEAGAAAQVGTRIPAELLPLTGALNAMIVGERNQLTRYRNALGDLAHSLKTPLAVLRGLTERQAPDAAQGFAEQLGRMQQIVDHQLGRAAAAGRRTLAEPVAVRPIADKIIAALRKVYAERGLEFDVAVPPQLRARVDAEDCYELIGNTLDNAAKWARHRVRIAALGGDAQLHVHVDDDGPGFPAEAERLLERGARADTRTPGQGLGLAAVAEIVRACGGTVTLGRAPDLAGARVTLVLPSGR